MKGISFGSLNYPGTYIIEEYQRSFFYQSDNYVELPWLNLLCYLPICEAKQDQSVTIGHYHVLRSIYDKNKEFFQSVKEQLKLLFPNSFLFREMEEPLQYCSEFSDILTLERLKILHNQMIELYFLNHFDKETILAEAMRIVWRQTQMPMQHMTLHAFDYENALLLEDYRKLTWFIPFSEKYPELGRSVKRYLTVY